MIDWPDIAMMARGGAIGLQLLMIWILWRDHRHTAAGRIGILFLLGVICHIIATISIAGGGQIPAPGHLVFEILSNAAPGLFWLFARAWFGDEQPGWRSWALVALSVVLMQIHAWTLWLDIEPWILPTGIVGRAASIGMAALGLHVAWRGRGEDLIEERRRMRVWGVGAIGLYTLLVLTVEIWMRPGWIVYLPEARHWLMMGIFLLSLAASVAIMATNRADLFGAPKRGERNGPTSPQASADPELAAQLSALMAEEMAWREEGLSIAELARRLDTQEYRLRRLINGQLGHRNFAAFLNGYRLDEVRQALADPEQREVPILTIAIDAGFGSLGPFNRAFKEAEGMTPSEYRATRAG